MRDKKHKKEFKKILGQQRKTRNKGKTRGNLKKTKIETVKIVGFQR
jgi:hypothetical protein